MSFPDNVLDAVKQHLSLLDAVELVEKRSLNQLDPSGSVGLVSDEWLAEEVEMGPMGFEPTTSTYLVTIQHVVKHSDVEQGGLLHRKAAKSIRLMLYRDPGLTVALRQLNEVEDGRRERMLQWKIIGQRFASNQISGIFTSMSVTEFSFTTETTNS